MIHVKSDGIRFGAARAADIAQAVAIFHDMREASVLIREAGEELPHRELAEFLFLRMKRTRT